jgi:exodeoxyribonuclease V alpha subunit
MKKDNIEFNPDPTIMIKEDPYSLSTFGMDFKMIDRIAKKHFKIENCDPRRLTSIVTQALRALTSKGNTAVYPSQLRNQVRKIVDDDNEQVSRALTCSYDKRAFIVYPDSGVYQFTPNFIMENTVAKRFLKLYSQGEIYNEEEDAACVSAFKAFETAERKLEPQQREAVMVSVSYAISCITGGAGTGKTTVLNAVLNAYDVLGYNIKAIALSGRAAMRMRQSIHRPSSTIAKFLKEDPLEDLGDNKFLLVIDESSMLDLPTIFKIVTHISPAVRILFVGDPNQLPPIGAGNILGDIVKSGIIHNTELNIVKRQGASSGIPEYSKSIRDGVVPPIEVN